MVSHVHRLNDNEPDHKATLDEIAELLRPIAALATMLKEREDDKNAKPVDWDDPADGPEAL